MVYKKIKDPICNYTIHLMVSTEKELEEWTKRRNVTLELDVESIETANAITFPSINDNDEPMIWFRQPKEALQLATVVHETFHLWTFMKSKLVGSRMIRLDVGNAEYDAYHFDKLCGAIVSFAFVACDEGMYLPWNRWTTTKEVLPLHDPVDVVKDIADGGKDFKTP